MTRERGPLEPDRRRRDRRSAFVRLADYSVPELRKAVLTTALLVVAFVLFVYMVHEVLVAMIVGLVVGIYALPFYGWLARRLRNPAVTAIVTITAITVPLVVLLVYSWVEVREAAEYLARNSEEVAARINAAIGTLPFAAGLEIEGEMPRYVRAAAQKSGQIVEELQETFDIVVISVAVFLFTVFYILTDRDRIAHYLGSKVPGRYRPLSRRITDNVRAVAYGALYATFLTQLLKSSVVLLMNLAWDVPLAAVLAIVSFFIGFFPVVGSWSVYVPVSLYLMVFRGDYVGGVAMLVIGVLGITMFMSMYLRPKIAAEKSRVLNFYWMFIALVTGVYTFGLVGIIIGPVLIGVLKAVFESVAAGAPPEVTGPRAGDAGAAAAVRRESG